jgi:cell division protein FtsZ
MAISSPLLEDVSIDGATGILINITGGPDLGLHEVNEACSLVQEAAHEDANIIFGSVVDPNIGDEVRITVIATGFDRNLLGISPSDRGKGASPRAYDQSGQITNKEYPPATRHPHRGTREVVVPQSQMLSDEEVPIHEETEVDRALAELSHETMTATPEASNNMAQGSGAVPQNGAVTVPLPSAASEAVRRKTFPKVHPNLRSALEDEESELDVPTFLRR